LPNVTKVASPKAGESEPSRCFSQDLKRACVRPRAPTACVAAAHAPIVGLAGLQGFFDWHGGFGGNGENGVRRAERRVFAPHDFIARSAADRKPTKGWMNGVHVFFVAWRKQDRAADGWRWGSGWRRLDRFRRSRRRRWRRRARRQRRDAAGAFGGLCATRRWLTRGGSAARRWLTRGGSAVRGLGLARTRFGRGFRATHARAFGWLAFPSRGCQKQGCSRNQNPLCQRHSFAISPKD